MDGRKCVFYHNGARWFSKTEEKRRIVIPFLEVIIIIFNQYYYTQIIDDSSPEFDTSASHTTRIPRTSNYCTFSYGLKKKKNNKTL